MPLVLRKWFTVALWNSNLREGRRHRKWQKWPDFHTGSPIVFSTQGGRDRSQILALIWYTKHHSLVTWSCFFLEIFPSSTRLLVSRWRPADSGSFITLMVASTMIDYRSHSHLATATVHRRWGCIDPDNSRWHCSWVCGYCSWHLAVSIPHEGQRHSKKCHFYSSSPPVLPAPPPTMLREVIQYFEVP